MTAAELEKLLAEVTPGEWDRDGFYVIETDEYHGICTVCSFHADADAHLIAMAPALARRVIAAERMAEALREYKARATRVPFDLAMSSDKALAAYEAAK